MDLNKDNTKPLIKVAQYMQTDEGFASPMGSVSQFKMQDADDSDDEDDFVSCKDSFAPKLRS